MTKTLADIIRTGLNALLTSSQSEERPTTMEIAPSELYPSRITNGSVKRLLDSGELTKLSGKAYELKTNTVDVAYAEVRPGTLVVCFDYKTGRIVNPEIVEKRLLGLDKTKKPIVGTLAYA